MALERQPKIAISSPDLVKSYRPAGEWVGVWHTVAAKESFTTIASRYGVPVDSLIQVNFPGAIEGNRVVPEIVNWYLHYHVDFQGCPETHDRRNRMFKGGERLAIPKRVIRLPEIELHIQRPTGPVPNLDGIGDIFASEKFAHEFKIPPQPKEIGYFLVQFRASLEGEISHKAGFVKTQFKKDQVKVGIEKKLDTDLKATLSLKVDKKTIETVSEEIKKGSKEGFLRALAAPFEASLKQTYSFGRLSLVPELGAEFSLTPVIIRVAGEYKDVFLIEGLQLDGKFIVKGGFNVGLSKAGWAEVAKRIGWEAIKRFLLGAGRSLAATWQMLVAEGVVAAGAVVVGTVLGTLAITSLMAWIVANASRKGQLRGLSRWYSSAYKAKIFRELRPTGALEGGLEAAKLRDELVAMGEKDAVTMAEMVLRDLNELPSYPTEAAKLERLREIVISALGNGNEADAKQALVNRLNQEVERKLGL